MKQESLKQLATAEALAEQNNPLKESIDTTTEEWQTKEAKRDKRDEGVHFYASIDPTSKRHTQWIFQYGSLSFTVRKI